MKLEKPPSHACDAPSLWERAKAMFATLRAAFTTANEIVVAALTGRARRDMFARLKPLERVVRLLMLAEAVDYLLMTPKGASLRHETPKRPPLTPPDPQPEPDSEPETAPRSSGPSAMQTTFTRILMPGWQTIAAYHPCIDPRVVEREQREALARREAIKANPLLAPCRFRMFSGARPTLPPPPPISTEARWHSHYPLVRGITRVDDLRAKKATQRAEPIRRDALICRIEALARVLANPRATVLRIARRLAALTADDMPEVGHYHARSRAWPEGGVEYRAAFNIAAPAIDRLTRWERWRCRPPEAG